MAGSAVRKSERCELILKLWLRFAQIEFVIGAFLFSVRSAVRKSEHSELILKLGLRFAQIEFVIGAFLFSASLPDFGIIVFKTKHINY